MSTASERASARAAWPVVRSSLADEKEPIGPVDAQAAWHAVLELTREAYATANALPPRLPRAQWPSRIIRAGIADAAG